MARLAVSNLALAAALSGCSAAAREEPVGFVRTDAGSETSAEGGIAVDAESCHAANDTDDDGDGWSESEGDCNDCDPLVNPGALDIPKNHLDDDCDGRADAESMSCDQGLALADGDATNAARALGLCRFTAADARAEAKTWGVLSAKYVKPDGSPLGTTAAESLSHGLLPGLGVNLPLAGATMLALSSGSARDPSMPGYMDLAGYKKGWTSGTPAGYPKDLPACPGIRTGAAHDGVALEVVLRVPTNVKSFAVSENFFTTEYPGYVCSKYNDWFVVDVDPKVPEYDDGNVAFDGAGNPISVNTSLLQVCKPQVANGRAYECPLGPDALQGTGFDRVDDPFSPAPHAATGWLRTKAKVVPGSVIRIRFAVWDSSDGNLDSTVLLDDFAWLPTAESGTAPVPR